jgi:hypothetical protein
MQGGNLKKYINLFEEVSYIRRQFQKLLFCRTGNFQKINISVLRSSL